MRSGVRRRLRRTVPTSIHDIRFSSALICPAAVSG